MCCPLDHVRTNFVPTGLAIEKKEEAKICTIKGYIDRSPKTMGEQLIRSFQSLEWIEKIAEIVDESFHLLGSLLQTYTSPVIFENAQALHHHAHEIEHFLHATCFLGDLTRLFTGNFLEYNDHEKTQVNFLRSIARVFHAVGHLFATISYLAEKKIIHLRPVETFLKVGTVLTSLGYLTNVISLTSDLILDKVSAEDQFNSNMIIQTTGFISEINPESKIGSLTKIIHAWCVAKRLAPADRQDVIGQFYWPNEEIESLEGQEDHDHHDHDHHHAIPPKFQNVEAVI